MNKKTKILFFMTLSIVSLSFMKQYENDYCDLDCMEQALDLTDPIAAEGDYQQAYEHFEAIYEYCTSNLC